MKKARIKNNNLSTAVSYLIIERGIKYEFEKLDSGGN